MIEQSLATDVPGLLSNILRLKLHIKGSISFWIESVGVLVEETEGVTRCEIPFNSGWDDSIVL